MYFNLPCLWQQISLPMIQLIKTNFGNYLIILVIRLQYGGFTIYIGLFMHKHFYSQHTSEGGQQIVVGYICVEYPVGLILG